jgi:hypothetical protein
MKAAYTERLKAIYHPLYRQPYIHAITMDDIVEKIIQQAD